MFIEGAALPTRNLTGAAGPFEEKQKPMNADRQSQIKAIIAIGKEKGYLSRGE